jgi:hypothetical protein
MKGLGNLESRKKKEKKGIDEGNKRNYPSFKGYHNWAATINAPCGRRFGRYRL